MVKGRPPWLWRCPSSTKPVVGSWWEPGRQTTTCQTSIPSPKESTASPSLRRPITPVVGSVFNTAYLPSGTVCSLAILLHQFINIKGALSPVTNQLTDVYRTDSLRRGPQYQDASHPMRVHIGTFTRPIVVQPGWPACADHPCIPPPPPPPNLLATALSRLSEWISHVSNLAVWPVSVTAAVRRRVPPGCILMRQCDPHCLHCVVYAWSLLICPG